MGKNIINSQKIKDFMEENDYTKTKVCKMCHIDKSSLEKILRNCYDSKIIAIYKIAKVMNCPIKDLFC